MKVSSRHVPTKLRTSKHLPSYRPGDPRAPDPPTYISVGIDWSPRDRAMVVADGDNSNASKLQRARLGLNAKEPFEFHFTKQRPLKLAERRVAEDRQVLDRVATLEASTIAALARAFLNAMSTTLDEHRVYVLDWGADQAARRERLRAVLDRLCAAKLVRLVGSKWLVTRKGYRLIGWKRWPLHLRAMAWKLVPKGST